MDILRAQGTSSSDDRALAGSHRKTTKLRGTLNFDFRILEDSDDIILPVENTYGSFLLSFLAIYELNHVINPQILTMKLTL